MAHSIILTALRRNLDLPISDLTFRDLDSGLSTDVQYYNARLNPPDVEVTLVVRVVDRSPRAVVGPLR